MYVFGYGYFKSFIEINYKSCDTFYDYNKNVVDIFPPIKLTITKYFILILLNILYGLISTALFVINNLLVLIYIIIMLPFSILILIIWVIDYYITKEREIVATTCKFPQITNASDIIIDNNNQEEINDNITVAIEIQDISVDEYPN